LLLIRGILAAFRQTIHLATCPNLPSHLYPKGIVVSDREMDELNISRDAFHGEWNYTMQPTSQSARALVSG